MYFMTPFIWHSAKGRTIGTDNGVGVNDMGRFDYEGVGQGNVIVLRG